MRRTSWALALVAAVFVGWIVVLLAVSDGQRSSSINFEIVGQSAPQFNAVTLDGERFDLMDQRGRWVVLNFFASWCVGCRVEHPELVSFSEAHREDAVVVSVMFGDTVEGARSFFDELGGGWPTVAEETGPIAIDYGVTAVPETLLISPSGRVVQKWIGANGVTKTMLESAIR